MIVIYCEINKDMWTCDFIVVLKNTVVQNSASAVCQTRVPFPMFGVTVANKYEVLIVLGQCRDISAGADAAPIVGDLVLVGIYTAVTLNAVSGGSLAIIQSRTFCLLVCCLKT
jgi:hypothetical protein